MEKNKENNVQPSIEEKMLNAFKKLLERGK